MPFSTLFQLYRSGQCTYPCFPEVPLTSTLHNILSKPMAAIQHVTIAKTMDNCERGMNPVAMTIINSWKKILAEPGIEPGQLLGSLWKTLWENEKGLVTSIFSFSDIVLYHSANLNI